MVNPWKNHLNTKNYIHLLRMTFRLITLEKKDITLREEERVLNSILSLGYFHISPF